MIYKPGRGYGLAMFSLAGLCFAGAVALIMGMVVSDLFCCSLAFCIVGGMFLTANGSVSLLSATRINGNGVEIKVWFRRATIPWDQLREWAVIKQKSGDFKDRFIVRFHLEPDASVLDLWEWEVQNPGFDLFIEELRKYCGSKERPLQMR